VIAVLLSRLGTAVADHAGWAKGTP